MTPQEVQQIVSQLPQGSALQALATQNKNQGGSGGWGINPNAPVNVSGTNQADNDFLYRWLQQGGTNANNFLTPLLGGNIAQAINGGNPVGSYNMQSYNGQLKPFYDYWAQQNPKLANPQQQTLQAGPGTHSMRALAAMYPKGTTIDPRTGQAVAPPHPMNTALQQSGIMQSPPGQAAAGGQSPITAVGPSSGSIVKMAGGNQQQVSGIAIGNPTVDPNKQPVGGIVSTPPPSSVGGTIGVGPSGPTTTGGPGTGPGVGVNHNPNAPTLVGSSLGTGPMFPPAVPAGTPQIGQPGAESLQTAYQKYLNGGGADLPLFHYQPGSAALPSFNASAMMQAQRQSNGNFSGGFTPYGGLPYSGATIGPQSGQILNATLANSGLLGG